MENFTKTKLNDYKDEIQPILEKFLSEKVQEYGELYPFAKLFLEHLAEFTLRGGKRLRPALMYYSYMMFEDEDLDEVKKVSIYLELIQSFLLIHDDIMDRSLLRREGDTMHKIFEAYSLQENFQDDVHFGNTMGILNGDLACLLAYEIINSSKLSTEKKSALSFLVSKEITKVIFGQIQDIILAYKEDYSKEEILGVHHYKTAIYTFKLPVFSGAMLANASKDKLKILEDYAINCGIAYQIRDDILGVFGDDKTIGKGTVSDIIEDKKTLLILHAYSKANRSQKKILDCSLGNKDITHEQVVEFKKVLEQTGALDYSIKECEKYVKEAKESLRGLSVKKNEGFDFLDSVVDYLSTRKY